MKKYTIILLLILIAISAFPYIFEKEKEKEKEKENNQKQLLKPTVNQKNSDSDSDSDSDSKAYSFVNKNKVIKELSSDASLAYKKALDKGWSSIVDDFVNKRFEKTNMTQEEKNKLCDNVIIRITNEELKKLLTSDCRPTGTSVSNSIIMHGMKDENGNLDEKKIISKIKTLNEQGLLTLKASYNKNLKEDKFGDVQISLFDTAVSIGANEVIDYVVSLGGEPSPNKNPIFVQVSYYPKIDTINKLLNMGYTADIKTIDFMKHYNFNNKHPEIYELLVK